MALAAVLIGVVAVVVVLLGSGGEKYEVKARFQNASQLVKGNLVQISGKAVGEVTNIELTDNGEAEVTLSIDEDTAPLREGTSITVRQASLSGIANRYLDLRLPPAGAKTIPDGGVIGQRSTTTAVDLDQLFNVFDPETRRALRDVIRGSATQYAGMGARGNAGLLYLNPSLISTARLSQELTRSKSDLRAFFRESSQLVGDIDERRDDLAGLITNLATTTTAIGNQSDALQEAIAQLPDFMRRSNSTFVNLRTTLDDFAPLVEESKPVAKKLRPFLAELRPLARDARPTLRDLSALARSTGPNNDLIELNNSTVSVNNIATRPGTRNGQTREGAFPASVKALRRSTPKLADARPYAPDLLGWFDDFSHSGIYDALGGHSRVQLGASVVNVANGLPILPILTPAQQQAAFQSAAALAQYNRCPGALERNQDGSNAGKPTPDFNCDPSQRIPGS